MKYLYVTETNIETKETKLIGWGLSEQQKDELFYCFKSPSGRKTSSDPDEKVKMSYGGHSREFVNDKAAYKELVAKPQEFNSALAVMEKYRMVVVSKDSVVVSYQQMKNEEF